LAGITLGSITVQTVLSTSRTHHCVSYGSGGDQWVYEYRSVYRVQYLVAATATMTIPSSTATVVEDAVYALLSANLTGLSSITPFKLPEVSTLPAACYFPVSNVVTPDLLGTPVYTTARMQISIFAWTNTAVQIYLVQLRQLFDGFAGTVSALDLVILAENSTVTQEFAADYTDRRKWMGTIDLMVRYCPAE
jgi:hypothetical protein